MVLVLVWLISVIPAILIKSLDMTRFARESANMTGFDVGKPS